MTDKPKIDCAISKIMNHISPDTIVSLAEDIELTYGETGNGTIHSDSLKDHAKQYLEAYIYDQLACVFGIED